MTRGFQRGTHRQFTFLQLSLVNVARGGTYAAFRTDSNVGAHVIEFHVINVVIFQVEVLV